VAEQDKPRRGARQGDDQRRQGGGRPSSGGRGGGAASGEGRSGSSRTGGSRTGSSRAGSSRGSGAGGAGRQGAGRPRRSAPTEAPRTAEQARYDGPPLDESISASELSRDIRQQLRGLPEKLAARVARHLVAAGRLIDDDPVTAYQHTLAARARAARIAVVREACGEAAYAAGEYAEALSELRAARRMTGRAEHLPVMADCERALGRPERALALAQDPAVADLDDATRAEMTIVAAGARRDLGEVDAALATLEAAPLRSRSRAEWVVRLRYAYADALLAAGRRAQAVEWFHRTAGVDGEGVTDAAERLAELEDGPEAGPTAP